jgi:hypothetical protein
MFSGASLISHFGFVQIPTVRFISVVCVVISINLLQVTRMARPILMDNPTRWLATFIYVIPHPTTRASLKEESVRVALTN